MGFKNWQTPVEWLAPFHKTRWFSLDPCGGAEDPIRELVPRFYGGYGDGMGIDGLKASWRDERVFCNPPYDASIPQWIRKAIAEPDYAMLLLPPSVDAAWFQDLIQMPPWFDMRSNLGRIHYWFPPGRIKFWRDGKPGPAPRAGNLVVEIWGKGR